MRMTLWLDDELFRQAKTKAAAQGISLAKLVEQAIREHLDEPEPPRRRILLPVSTATGGLVSGFSSLEEAADAADLSADRPPSG